MSANNRGRYHKAPICGWVVPDFVTSLSRPDEVTARSRQDAGQLTIEGRGHSRRGHHGHRLHALGDYVHLDLIGGRGEPILGRDFGSDFEHAGD
jgi:hypothetical protein